VSGIVTLTSDFGLGDAYVAIMKGVILSRNPDVKVVDVCHSVSPRNIAQAGFVLSTAYQFFPPRTVHVIVVDPGVGTSRKAVILRTPQADFVAPDNGILSYVLNHSANKCAVSGIDGRVELGLEMEAVAITCPKYWRTPVSNTFHGRDIFAPVAAHLSLGVPLDKFGEAVSSLNILPVSAPLREADGSLSGHIVHVDNFGNLITDITTDELPLSGRVMRIEVGGHAIDGLSRTYGDSGGLLALIGSSGHLEISVRNGSARDFLGTGTGGDIRIRFMCENSTFCTR